MIDDKKIEAAAEEYNEKVENELEKKHIPKRTFAERYAESAIRECAFKAGAKWADSVVCDRCGKPFIDEFNGIVAWLDEGTAKEQAMESEWAEIGDKHYCPECYEFDEKLDECVPKKKGGSNERT